MSFCFEFLQIAEKAAIASAAWIGRGDEKQADHAAVEAMRQELNKLNISGRIVIGEGERDQAPMLYIGEKLGQGGTKFDIAVDPLEGTTLCAKAMPGSMAVIAAAEEGGLLHAPDVYMEKIAIGPGYPEDIVDLDYPIAKNLHNLASYKSCPISELTIMVLERPRHAELIKDIRQAGARLHLISDGDIAASIATINQIDAYMGIGGAPEGVLAAAALAPLGGQFMGRLVFKNEEEKTRARNIGIEDLNKKYHINELVKGNLCFIASGVTSGELLTGVESYEDKIVTQSLVIDSMSQKMHIINTTYLNHA